VLIVLATAVAAVIIGNLAKTMFNQYASMEASLPVVVIISLVGVVAAVTLAVIGMRADQVETKRRAQFRTDLRSAHTDMNVVDELARQMENRVRRVERLRTAG
jgi:hypothetical protein